MDQFKLDLNRTVFWRAKSRWKHSVKPRPKFSISIFSQKLGKSNWLDVIWWPRKGCAISKRKNSESEFRLKVSDDPSNLSAFQVYDAVNWKNSEGDSNRKSKTPEKERNVVNPLTSLTEASIYFGMTNLTNSLKLLTNKNVTKTPNLELKFNRKSYPEFHDVTIRTEDDVEIAAHRCVLAARLDYFRLNIRS